MLISNLDKIGYWMNHLNEDDENIKSFLLWVKSKENEAKRNQIFTMDIFNVFSETRRDQISENDYCKILKKKSKKDCREVLGLCCKKGYLVKNQKLLFQKS